MWYRFHCYRFGGLEDRSIPYREFLYLDVEAFSKTETGRQLGRASLAGVIFHPGQAFFRGEGSPGSLVKEARVPQLSYCTKTFNRL